MRDAVDDGGGADGRWFSRRVLGPFVASRAALLLAAWFSTYFPIWHRAPADAPQRAPMRTAVRLLDAWARWDSGWYLSIAQDGYLSGPLVGQNRLAFYPGYPLVVGALHRLVPQGWRGHGELLALGVLVSNAFALAALALLYRHARDVLSDEAAAARAVVYLLAFPTAFFLSAVYTEGLFLFLSVAAFHAASRSRWWCAAAAAAGACLTRPTGILLLPALAWRYVEGWERHRLRDALVLLVPAAAFLGWAAFAGRLTGEPLAFLSVQRFWLKGFTSPWQTLLHPRLDSVHLSPIDGALSVLTIALGVAMLRTLPSKSYGIYALLCVASFIFSGTLTSAARYVLVAWPIFLVLARAGRSELFDRAFLFVSLTVQALFMAGWTRLYWIG